MQTEDYLQLSRDVVKALAETEKTQVVQFNKGQCNFLKEKLLQTTRRIGEDLDSLSCKELATFTQLCKAALQQLYRTVKDAEAIIHSCCTPKATIELTNINEACAQALFKLDWCTAVCLDCRLAVKASKFDQYVTKNIEGFGAVECKIKVEEIRNILLRYHALDHRDSSETMVEPQLSNNTQAVAQDSVASSSKLEISAPLNDERKTKTLDLLSIDPKELTWKKKIGSGGYGTVHEVSWKNERCARKDFKCNSSWEHEVKILAGLSHPNVVQVFGHCIAEKSSLVMELMQGNLNDHIEQRGKSLELPVALDIMLQIAEGIQYLHEKRVAHRDLKSMNILINPLEILGMENAGYVQVKVTDFGLSKIKEASATYSMQTANTGTTRWMAPELFEEPDPNKCRYPFKADVYSYAITCFEILTAKSPFEEASNTEVRRKVMAGERPVLPVTLPMFLSSLIERCWDAEANRRPSFSEICAELRHFQGVIMISDLATKLRGKIVGQERVEVWDDLQCYKSHLNSKQLNITLKIQETLKAFQSYL